MRVRTLWSWVANDLFSAYDPVWLTRHTMRVTHVCVIIVSWTLWPAHLTMRVTHVCVIIVRWTLWPAYLTMRVTHVRVIIVKWTLWLAHLTTASVTHVCVIIIRWTLWLAHLTTASELAMHSTWQVPWPLLCHTVYILCTMLLMHMSMAAVLCVGLSWCSGGSSVCRVKVQ